MHIEAEQLFVSGG